MSQRPSPAITSSVARVEGSACYVHPTINGFTWKHFCKPMSFHSARVLTPKQAPLIWIWSTKEEKKIIIKRVVTNAANVLASRAFLLLLSHRDPNWAAWERPEADLIWLRPEIAHANQEQYLAARFSATSNTRRVPYWYHNRLHLWTSFFIDIRELQTLIHSDATLTETYILIHCQQ